MKASSVSVRKFILWKYIGLQVLREYSSWASRNGAVQMFFLAPARNMFAVKFVN